MGLSKINRDLNGYVFNVDMRVRTHLFEGEPAAGRVGRVGGVSQSLQSRDDGITIRLLEPRFMWSLCWSCCDAVHVIQGENHGAHQSRVLLTHYGNLFIPATQQTVELHLQTYDRSKHPMQSGQF